MGWGGCPATHRRRHMNSTRPCAGVPCVVGASDATARNVSRRSVAHRQAPRARARCRLLVRTSVTVDCCTMWTTWRGQCTIADVMCDVLAVVGCDVRTRKWGRRATAASPEHAVSTCHSYDVKYKYVYQCTNTSCTASFGRHSKSIDVAREVSVLACQLVGAPDGRLHLLWITYWLRGGGDAQVCGRCRSSLVLLNTVRKDGTPAKTRAATPFRCGPMCGHC